MTSSITTLETTDLLSSLATHRDFLRGTLRGLTDEQAASTPTVSALCLGGLIKHVAYVEAGWARFIALGAAGLGPQDASGYEAHEASLRMEPDETVASLLDAYAEVARATDDLIAGLPDLDVAHPLPEAPWFEPGATWSARRAVTHILAETSQHAGHADIIREAIDGAKTMG
ncbi:MAG TPA: DinB family protein [Frankiaceae bacterium]|jgi:uncharacterized damage-inducible protein DinB|nr:DinB family protein [Frankiaceae bacterium]